MRYNCVKHVISDYPNFFITQIVGNNTRIMWDIQYYTNISVCCFRVIYGHMIIEILTVIFFFKIKFNLNLRVVFVKCLNIRFIFIFKCMYILLKRHCLLLITVLVRRRWVFPRVVNKSPFNSALPCNCTS